MILMIVYRTFKFIKTVFQKKGRNSVKFTLIVCFEKRKNEITNFRKSGWIEIR